jgi:uncharacterized protein (DUF1778 family)
VAKGKKRKPGGTKRMREFGYRRVEVWLDSNELKLIEQAADLVNRKLATFCREAAFGSAAVVVQSAGKHAGTNEDMWEKMIEQTPGGQRDA